MGKKRSHAEANSATPKKGKPGFKGGDNKKSPAAGFSKSKKSIDSAKTAKPQLIFTPRPDWHAAELPELPIIEDPSPVAQHVIDALYGYAEKLLEAENAAYNASNLSSTSSSFYSTIVASGTMEDKVSALTLGSQESPLHTMKSFENLLGQAKKRSRNHALMALAALKDLLGQGAVLPPERKLKAFGKQPGLISALQGKSVNWSERDRLPGKIQKVHLISWAYEDWLKRCYFEILKVLEIWCNDELGYSRARALTFVFELLKDKPEQEENLLRLLINKLGDTDKKIASRASYLLLQLQVEHPVMKNVVINAIESELLFRPGQSSHAKYYAIITLNQTVLSTKEPEVANKLLDIYFSLFLTLLKKLDIAEAMKPKVTQGGGGTPGKKAKEKAKQKIKELEAAHASEEQLKEKLIAQILTGVNRAFPFSDSNDPNFENNINTLFRVTHSSNFNTSIQALMLIQQISATKHYSADRFYRTLYESLLDPRLLTSSKQVLYLNLLYRSLKSDVSIKRVKAFVKRLVQVIAMHDPPFICGVLYLISELQKTFPSIKTMFDTAEQLDDEEEKFVDAPEEQVDDKSEDDDTQAFRKNAYDSRKRDPEHSNADRSCLWELLPLQAHFHPSVTLFASRLLNQDTMPPKPDPTLHTLMHFLDRFVYRNPKSKSGASRGSSIMQPLAGANTADLLISQRAGSKSELPFNSEAFWKKKVEDVAVDEVFFHKYFSESGKGKSKKEAETKKDKKSKADEDEDESGSDGEDEIWNALVNSRPELEGADEDEEDFDMDDLESGDEAALAGSDEEEMAPEAGEDEDEGAGGSDDGFDFAELESADEALLDSDEDLPSDFDIDSKDAADEDEDESEDEAPKKKRRKEERERKKKLKHLPTFASMEDYAKLLGDDDDEDL